MWLCGCGNPTCRAGILTKELNLSAQKLHHLIRRRRLCAPTHPQSSFRPLVYALRFARCFVRLTCNISIRALVSIYSIHLFCILSLLVSFNTLCNNKGNCQRDTLVARRRLRRRRRRRCRSKFRFILRPLLLPLLVSVPSYYVVSYSRTAGQAEAEAMKRRAYFLLYIYNRGDLCPNAKLRERDGFYLRRGVRFQEMRG